MTPIYLEKGVVWEIFMQIRERIEKPFQKRKGEIILFALAVVVITAFMGAKQIVTTSSTVGDRELPIYCVETEEKKIALTFDAAWADIRWMEQ